MEEKALSSESYLKVANIIETFMNSLKSKNILISNMGGGKLRMVTHLDYTDDMHEKLLETLVSIF